MYRLIYYPVLVVFQLLALLPLRILYFLSDLLFILVYHVMRYRRKMTDKNLRNAFPEKTEKERLKIAKEFYHHLCDYFFETIKMLHLSQNEIAKRVRYTNIDILDSYYHNKQSVILYLGHYGNWEWLAPAKYAQMHRDDMKIYPVYHTLEDKAFDKIFKKIRTSQDSIPIPQEKILRTMVTNNKEKKSALYIFISDQSSTRRNIHYWTSFLNQDTGCVTGAERIAQQTGYPCLYVDIQRIKRGYYDVTFLHLTDKTKELPDFALTEKYMRLMEKTILRAPAYWLWTHNRWRQKRDKNEL